MAKILITSGPTRQYIDPVRYLNNASSRTTKPCEILAAIEKLRGKYVSRRDVETAEEEREADGQTVPGAIQRSI